MIWHLTSCAILILAPSMFISKRDAEVRLRSERNLFRSEGSLPVPESIPDVGEVVPGEIDNGMSEEGEAEGSSSLEGATGSSTLDHKSKSVGNKTPEKSSAFTHLDELLSPRVVGRNGKPRANYRGKLESQVGIAETSLILGPTAAGRVFDLSTPQANAYKEGHRSHADMYPSGPEGLKSPKLELKARINEFKGHLALKAASRLDATLDAILPAKIEAIESVSELARIAKDMAMVMEKVSDKEHGVEGGVHFHIYKPEMQSIQSYATVSVGPVIPTPPPD